MAGLPSSATASRLPDSDWQTATAKELFFYLVDCPEGRRKEIILADLWPDQDPPRASENFHTSLRRLRRALDSDAVRVEDTVYRLNPALGLWHDGAEVLALIHRGRQATDPAAARGYWTTAASFMRAPFADEFYGEWAAELRTAWEARAREVLSWLAEDALRRADYVPAGIWAQELCVLDPINERVHALLMQIAAGRGDIGQVHQQFATLRRVLWDELGTAPSAPTVALYRRLVDAAEPPA